MWHAPTVHRSLAAGLFVLLACSSRDDGRPGPGVENDGGTETDGATDAGRRVVPDTCDPVTGAGCDCSEVGATRACMVAGGCPSVQECAVAGEFAKWSECTEEPSATEACNGADDDCDGTVDEGFADETCGVGACATTVATCVDGAPRECVPGDPGMETCTGSADEDCDGLADCADSDCATDPACDDCPCRTGTRCAAVGDIICVPAPDYPCMTSDGWYAICEPSGWTCMFTTPPIC